MRAVQPVVIHLEIPELVKLAEAQRNLGHTCAREIHRTKKRTVAQAVHIGDPCTRYIHKEKLCKRFERIQGAIHAEVIPDRNPAKIAQLLPALGDGAAKLILIEIQARNLTAVAVHSRS